MFNDLCKRYYETQGDVYQAIAEITGDFDWPHTHLYYEESSHKLVDTPIGELSISLYRFASGRYEVTCYPTK